jgi:hypothetical protein
LWALLFFRIDIMDKVEDELEFHRHDGDLKMVVCLEWRNLVQPELRAVPRVDDPFLIERGDPHPHYISGPTHPLRK